MKYVGGNDMDSLWPQNFECSCDGKKFPNVILENQAAFLPKLTNNLLYAKVLPEYDYKSENDIINPFCNNTECAYSFKVTSRDFNDCAYWLFSISYGTSIYPLKITMKNVLLNEILTIDPQFNYIQYKTFNYISVENEREFKKYIQLIFNSNTVKLIIYQLMNMCKQLKDQL